MPGVKGEKGDMEYTSYFRGNESIQWVCSSVQVLSLNNDRWSEN
jgi:hypothetical protein